MQLFKGSYFSVDATSRHFWPNSAIAKGTDERIYELFFTRLKVEYKRSYISKVFQWSNNWYLDMDFNSKLCGL